MQTEICCFTGVRVNLIPKHMWYYVEDGQQRGPVVDADFAALRRDGKITPETLIWREGMENWLPVSQVPNAPSTSGLTMAAPAAAAMGAPGATTTAAAAPMGAPGASVGAGAATGVTCSECGRVFPASEVIRYGNASVCASCKPLFMQKLREGATYAGRPMVYAGFWIRFGAQFVDGIITNILSAIAGAAVGAILGASGLMQRGQAGIVIAQLVGMVVALIISAAYFIYFTGKDGQTPGKKLCKIKVVNADGSDIGYGKATGRYFCYALSYMICLIGFMMAGWDDEKRALHDRICDTRVIKVY